MTMNRAFGGVFAFVVVSLLVFCGAARAQDAKPTLGNLELSAGRFQMPAVVLGDKIYVLGGGGEGGILTDAERIDVQNSVVSELPPPLVARVCHTAQADGKYIYIMGGGPKQNTLSPILERYDPDGKVSVQMASMPTPRRLAASAIVNGKIYVIGGDVPDAKNSYDGLQRVSTVEIYDIATDTWTAGPPMPTARECAVGVKDNVIYAVGGFDGHIALKTVESLDTSTGTWSKLPDMPFRLSAHHIVVDGDKLFTFGDYAVLTRVTCYDFGTQAWRVLKVPLQPRRHAAVALIGHTAYVIGGDVPASGGVGVTPLTSVQGVPLAPYEH